MIISETALSFLGLGLRPPAISWGVLLQQAQNVQTVAISPWLMLPAVPGIVAVMGLHLPRDGPRAAPPPLRPQGPQAMDPPAAPPPPPSGGNPQTDLAPGRSTPGAG